MENSQPLFAQPKEVKVQQGVPVKIEHSKN